MKNLLIVDGYNAVHKIETLRARLSVSLESARAGLLGLVSAWKSRHPAFDCVVVFDSKEGGGREANPSGVLVVFTAGREADDEILSVIKAREGSAAEIVVVSEDNYVRNNCRAHKVRIEPASYLLPRAAGKRLGGAAPSGSEEKNLGRKARSEINDELRRAFGIDREELD